MYFVSLYRGNFSTMAAVNKEATRKKVYEWHEISNIMGVPKISYYQNAAGAKKILTKVEYYVAKEWPKNNSKFG